MKRYPGEGSAGSMGIVCLAGAREMGRRRWVETERSEWKSGSADEGIAGKGRISYRLVDKGR